MILKVSIILAMAMGLVSETLSADSVVYSYLQIVSYVFLTGFVFFIIPYQLILCKTLSFSWFVFSSLNLIIQLITGFYKWNELELYPLFFVLVVLSFRFCLFKSYSMPSDKYNIDGVYIVFRKPSSFIGFVLGLAGKPVDTVSIISDGLQYCYTKKSGLYHRRKYIADNSHVYVKTRFNNNYVLNHTCTRMNRKWSKKDNCCHAVLDLYPNLKSKLLIKIPAFIMSIITKEERCQIQ